MFSKPGIMRGFSVFSSSFPSDDFARLWEKDEWLCVCVCTYMIANERDPCVSAVGSTDDERSISRGGGWIGWCCEDLSHSPSLLSGGSVFFPPPLEVWFIFGSALEGLSPKPFWGTARL